MTPAQGDMNRRTRWILVVPAAIVAWFTVFFVLANYYNGLTSMCDSGPALPECHTTWYLMQKKYLPAFGAAASAVVVVFVVYFVSPVSKLRAAWVGCALGSIVAAMIAAADQMAAIGAISAGLLTAAFLTYRNRGAAADG